MVAVSAKAESSRPAPYIGVLALQGAVAEHMRMAQRAGAKSLAVKSRQDLARADALVIPGGESTAISRLIQENNLTGPIQDFAKTHPVLGTCAGLILCGREIVGQDGGIRGPRPLGLIDISVERNGFGRQVDSFETLLPVAGLGEVPAVFIRAPFIHGMGPGVRALAEVDGKTVMAESGNILVAAFHPELADDLSVYTYFKEKIA